MSKFYGDAVTKELTELLNTAVLGDKSALATADKVRSLTRDHEIRVVFDRVSFRALAFRRKTDDDRSIGDPDFELVAHLDDEEVISLGNTRLPSLGVLRDNLAYAAVRQKMVFSEIQAIETVFRRLHIGATGLMTSESQYLGWLADKNTQRNSRDTAYAGNSDEELAASIYVMPRRYKRPKLRLVFSQAFVRG